MKTLESSPFYYSQKQMIESLSAICEPTVAAALFPVVLPPSIMRVPLMPSLYVEIDLKGRIWYNIISIAAEYISDHKLPL